MKRSLLILLVGIMGIHYGFSQTFGGGTFAGLSASQLDGDQWEGIPSQAWYLESIPMLN